MFSSITGALGAAKGMTELLKSANDIKTAAEVNTIKIDMQSLIIDLQANLMVAQQDYQKIINELATCQKELQSLKDFDNNTNDYEAFTEKSTGAVIYRRKDGNTSVDLCPVCYSNKIKSFLQPRFHMRKKDSGKECPQCSKIFWIE